MVSKREQVLGQLFTALGAISGPRILRNENLPERVPEEGLLILRDGDPGEPEIVLSPREYIYEHRAALEVIVDAATPAARDALFDELMLGIGSVIAGDRTLGGLCDYVEAEAPAPLDLAVEGAPGLKAAVLPIILNYGTPDPLSASSEMPIVPGDEVSLIHMLIAAENISALRVIARDENGEAVYADKDDLDSIRALAGVSRNAAGIGAQVQITTFGIWADNNWNWNMAIDPALFLGANGAITQGPQAGLATVRVGLAISPTTMLVRLGEPVINA